MAFENDTNRGRVEKLLETFGHIQKSAKSNRASPDDIAKLLAPFTAVLRDSGALDAAMRCTPTTPAPVPADDAVDRASLDRAIAQMKVDRALKAIEDLPALLQALVAQMDKRAA